MSSNTDMRQQCALLWKFTGFFLRPPLRLLHAVLLVGVPVQCLLGFGGSLRGRRGMGRMLMDAHVLCGAALTVGVVLFVLYCLRERGVRRYFSYLWGDTAKLREDIAATLRLHVVPPRPGGLAVAVQGLVLAMLTLTALSGILWYMLRGGGRVAHFFKQTHELAALLLCCFFAVHAVMALRNFFLWQRKTAPQRDVS